MLANLFAQPLSTFFLVYLLVWSPPPHISYISSPNQWLLFATRAHTIATCFAIAAKCFFHRNNVQSFAYGVSCNAYLAMLV